MDQKTCLIKKEELTDLELIQGWGLPDIWSQVVPVNQENFCRSHCRLCSSGVGGVDWVRFWWFSDSELFWMCEYVSINEPLCCSSLGRRSHVPKKELDHVSSSQQRPFGRRYMQHSWLLYVPVWMKGPSYNGAIFNKCHIQPRISSCSSTAAH